MATKFKYDIDSLEWDSAHTRNKEGVYCYCGLDYNDGDPMLQCAGCSQLFHWDCVSCIKSKPLRGDSFFRFRCSVCNDGSEEYERDTLSWVQVVYLVLYHLIETEPDKKYFRWRENICATISDNWQGLMPGKAKTATWQNTVAGCLSTHHGLFKSGFDDTQQTGNWTLHAAVEPSKTHFKAAVKSREPKSGKAKTETKRPRKKAEVSVGSAAEKDILEVLNESSGSKKSARPRVSFSDDESDNEARGSKRKAKRRRAELKNLEDDADLLQSFEFFSQLEKKRLGGQADRPEDLVSDNEDSESLSSLSTLSTDSEIEDIEMESTTSDDVDEKGVKSVSPASPATKEENELVQSVRSMNVAEPASPEAGTGIEDKLADRAEEEDKGEAENEDGDEGQDRDMHSDTLVPDIKEDKAEEEPTESNAGADETKDESGEQLVDLPEPVWTKLDNIEPRLLFDGLDKSHMDVSSKTELTQQNDDDGDANMESSPVTLTSAARRLRRRLELRKYKQMLGLPLFDIVGTVKACMKQRQIPWPYRPIDRQAFELVGASYGTLDSGGDLDQGSRLNTDMPDTQNGEPRQDTMSGDLAHSAAGATGASTARESKIMHTGDVKTTAYANSFASRLMGRAVLCDSLTSTVAQVSPFHGRLLRPYIWRDTKPLSGTDSDETDHIDVSPDKSDKAAHRGLAMLRVLRAVRSHDHAIFRKLSLEPTLASEDESIDYVFFQRIHLDQVNALLCRTFWPGIDMSEALLYPEFSIVALYKRTVIGCAFLTPDAYLTYIAVSAGWEGGGIAKFMLHHLMQTLPTRDLTLHVSATNLAMLLYQKFGFKPEKYAVDFYKSYLPESSRVCPNAFFMRLRRY